MAANPKVRLGRVGGPASVGLPGRFVERGRGPGGVISGAPDALLRRDGEDGLRGERAGQRKGENQGRDNEQTRRQSLAKGKRGHEEDTMAQSGAKEISFAR